MYQISWVQPLRFAKLPVVLFNWLKLLGLAPPGNFSF